MNDTGQSEHEEKTTPGRAIATAQFLSPEYRLRRLREALHRFDEGMKRLLQREDLTPLQEAFDRRRQVLDRLDRLDRAERQQQ